MFAFIVGLLLVVIIVWSFISLSVFSRDSCTANNVAQLESTFAPSLRSSPLTDVGTKDQLIGINKMGKTRFLSLCAVPFDTPSHVILQNQIRMKALQGMMGQGSEFVVFYVENCVSQQEILNWSNQDNVSVVVQKDLNYEINIKKYIIGRDNVSDFNVISFWNLDQSLYHLPSLFEALSNSDMADVVVFGNRMVIPGTYGHLSVCADARYNIHQEKSIPKFIRSLFMNNIGWKTKTGNDADVQNINNYNDKTKYGGLTWFMNSDNFITAVSRLEPGIPVTMQIQNSLYALDEETELNYLHSACLVSSRAAYNAY